MNKAILNGHEVVETDDLREWGKWFQDQVELRIVEQTHLGVDAKSNNIMVSTVFLGLDHSFGIGPKLWFETMVFGGPMAGEMDRYPDWDSAAAGHRDMVARVKRGDLKVVE